MSRLQYSLSCKLARRPDAAVWDLVVGLLDLIPSRGIDEGQQAPPMGEAALRAANEYVPPAHATPIGFVAYFGNAADARRAQQAIESCLSDLSPVFEIREVEPHDHTELWKDEFAPIEVKPFWRVRAPWHVPAFPGKIDLIIDPGMAFGTGSHETTRGCLELIAGSLEGLTAAQLAEMSVLDLGCGSGILAIALKKLSAGRVIAVDIDHLAVEATRANASRNSVQLEAGPTVSALPPLDGIVANILKNTLIDLAPSFYEWLRPGGFLILSGLLLEQEQAVGECYAGAGFSARGRLLENGWVSLLLVKPSISAEAM